jgi:hypothetical protein
VPIHKNRSFSSSGVTLCRWVNSYSTTWHNENFLQAAQRKHLRRTESLVTPLSQPQITQIRMESATVTYVTERNMYNFRQGLEIFLSPLSLTCSTVPVLDEGCGRQTVPNVYRYGLVLTSKAYLLCTIYLCNTDDGKVPVCLDLSYRKV